MAAETFRDAVRAHMDRRGIGVRRLGSLAGLRHTSVARVVGGQRRATMGVAVALVAALDLSPRESRRLLLLAAAEHAPDDDRRRWVEGL